MPNKLATGLIGGARIHTAIDFPRLLALLLLSTLALFSHCRAEEQELSEQELLELSTQHEAEKESEQFEKDLKIVQEFMLEPENLKTCQLPERQQHPDPHQRKILLQRFVAKAVKTIEGCKKMRSEIEKIKDSGASESDSSKQAPASSPEQLKESAQPKAKDESSRK